MSATLSTLSHDINTKVTETTVRCAWETHALDASDSFLARDDSITLETQTILDTHVEQIENCLV